MIESAAMYSHIDLPLRPPGTIIVDTLGCATKILPVWLFDLALFPNLQEPAPRRDFGMLRKTTLHDLRRGVSL